jgi:creatinine amidohydrolase/Fe(II)-dependent formamide hydrolase-like protein
VSPTATKKTGDDATAVAVLVPLGSTENIHGPVTVELPPPNWTVPND